MLYVVWYIFLRRPECYLLRVFDRLIDKIDRYNTRTNSSNTIPFDKTQHFLVLRYCPAHGRILTITILAQ